MKRLLLAAVVLLSLSPVEAAECSWMHTVCLDVAAMAPRKRYDKMVRLNDRAEAACEPYMGWVLQSVPPSCAWAIENLIVFRQARDAAGHWAPRAQAIQNCDREERICAMPEGGR